MPSRAGRRAPLAPAPRAESSPSPRTPTATPRPGAGASGTSFALPNERAWDFAGGRGSDFSLSANVRETLTPRESSVEGELCRAQAADVKRLLVPGAIEEQWFLEVWNTKSRKLRRVPLSAELVREVRSRVGRLVPYAERSPGSFAETAGALAGVEDFHVHRMRHTFACQWLERGGNLAALQLILGHASIETTQRYARLSDEAVMREAARVSRAQGGRSDARVGH